VVIVPDIRALVDPHNLPRPAAKRYRGLNEKIAPVSVKSLTA